MGQKLPKGYIWVTGSELMGLENEMKNRTTLPMKRDRDGNPTNATIRCISNLQRFMWEMEKPAWMSWVFWTDKYEKRYRSRIALHARHWMTDKRIRDRMISEGLI